MDDSEVEEQFWKDEGAHAGIEWFQHLGDFRIELRKRILKSNSCVVVGISEYVEFSNDDWANLDIDRRYICRRILTNYEYILVKEMVFPLHETAASHLVGSICAAIIRQLLQNGNQMPHETFRLHGSGRLKFERFSGEPDGGVGWIGEKIPFVFLEVGVSDTKNRTVNRVRHWLFKAKGKGRLGIALSIKYDDETLTCVDIETFRIVDHPPDQTVTRSSTYGKIVLLESLNLLQGDLTMTIPTDIVPFCTTQPLRPNAPTNLSIDLKNVLDVIRRAYAEI